MDYFRGQHRAAMNQLEAAAQETSTLRTKYGDLATEKQRLDREVSSLQQELRIHTQLYTYSVLNNRMGSYIKI